MTQSPNKAVTIERLAQLLEAYGGEPSRWPDAERASALQLLQDSQGAQRLQREALELDQDLDLSDLPEPATAQLRARVLEIPIRHERHQRAQGSVVLPRFGWKMALFGLAPCVLGFLSGTLFTDPMVDEDEQAWEELAQVVMPIPLVDDMDIFDEELP